MRRTGASCGPKRAVGVRRSSRSCCCSSGRRPSSANRKTGVVQAFRLARTADRRSAIHIWWKRQAAAGPPVRARQTASLENSRRCAVRSPAAAARSRSLPPEWDFRREQRPCGISREARHRGSDASRIRSPGREPSELDQAGCPTVGHEVDEDAAPRPGGDDRRPCGVRRPSARLGDEL